MTEGATEALAPCPFCGSADVRQVSDRIFGLCMNCGARASIAAWNRRAPVPDNNAADIITEAFFRGAARERAAIVAWLLLPSNGYVLAAAAIRHGEHLPAKEPGT